MNGRAYLVTEEKAIKFLIFLNPLNKFFPSINYRNYRCIFSSQEPRPSTGPDVPSVPCCCCCCCCPRTLAALTLQTQTSLRSDSVTMSVSSYDCWHCSAGCCVHKILRSRGVDFCLRGCKGVCFNVDHQQISAEDPSCDGGGDRINDCDVETRGDILIRSLDMVRRSRKYLWPQFTLNYSRKRITI